MKKRQFKVSNKTVDGSMIYINYSYNWSFEKAAINQIQLNLKTKSKLQQHKCNWTQQNGSSELIPAIIS